MGKGKADDDKGKAGKGKVDDSKGNAAAAAKAAWAYMAGKGKAALKGKLDYAKGKFGKGKAGIPMGMRIPQTPPELENDSEEELPLSEVVARRLQEECWREI